MKEERIMVLKMIENGKISPEEGERLLVALQGAESSKMDEFTSNVEERFQKAVSGINSVLKDIGAKVDEISKDIEPKVKKTAQIVVEKTSSAIDEISKTLTEKKEDICGDDDDEPKEN